MFATLHNDTNRELFEKHLCNQSNNYEKYGKLPFGCGDPLKLVSQSKPGAL